MGEKVASRIMNKKFIPKNFRKVTLPPLVNLSFAIQRPEGDLVNG